MSGRGGRVPLLMRALTELSGERTTMPTLEAIGRRCDMCFHEVNQQLIAAERRGLLEVTRDAEGRRIAVAAADGRFRFQPRPSSYAHDDGDAPPRPRRCLRCRETFKPRHRTNFLCKTCGRSNMGEAA